MKPSSVLKKSLQVLEQQGWTKHDYARNKYRHSVSPLHPSAVKFCMAGAIYHITKTDPDSQEFGSPVIDSIKLLENAVQQSSDLGWIADFNDDPQTKFEDVKKVFKLAIKKAKSEGK